MTKLSAYGIIAIGILHLLALGPDALDQISGWAAGGLWTWEHWKPVESQSADLVVSGFAFWSTIGSCAVPLILLGSLILWNLRQGIAIPRFIVFGLLGWSLLATLIMLPSGFPLLLLVASGLTLGVSRKSPARANRVR